MSTSTLVINPCMINVSYTNTPRFVNIFCEINYSNDGRLSITGVIGPKHNGGAYGGAGQIDMEFWHRNPEHNDSRTTDPVKPDELQFTEGWTADMWLTFLEYWHDWHLNDMRPACEHQRAMGWTYEEHHGMWVEGKPPKVVIIDEYDDGTANDPEPVFDKYKGHLCPVCGYSIGSRWLFESVPEEVIKWLFNLPVTTITPAWV